MSRPLWGQLACQPGTGTARGAGIAVSRWGRRAFASSRREGEPDGGTAGLPRVCARTVKTPGRSGAESRSYFGAGNLSSKTATDTLPSWVM
jgi:hypothetical protein